MNVYFFLAFAAFLLGNIASRTIINKAFTLLSDEDKVKIINLNTDHKSSKRGIIVLIITLIYLAVIFFKLLPVKPIFYVFMLSAIGYLVSFHFTNIKKLQDLNITPAYNQQTKISSIIRIISIVIFGFLLAIPM